MSDNQSDEGTEREAARMELGPDELHEGEEEDFFDCPNCGSPATVRQIIEEGRCSNYLDAEVTEGEGGISPTDTPCDAKLSLELVWWEE